TAVTWYSTTLFKSFFLDNTEKELTIRAEFVKREILSRYPDFALTPSFSPTSPDMNTIDFQKNILVSQFLRRATARDCPYDCQFNYLENYKVVDHNTEVVDIIPKC
ncbi:MAG: hypothetical protein HQK67_12410, partial [Desulfamplus sp.]|nr:hypothetical protein [Desulfamplus sp.]